MSTASSNTFSRLSTISTLVDAAISFLRGRRKSALILVAAAALSRRIPGLGTLVSIALRVARRLR